MDELHLTLFGSTMDELHPALHPRKGTVPTFATVGKKASAARFTCTSRVSQTNRRRRPTRSTGCEPDKEEGDEEDEDKEEDVKPP